MNSSTNDRQDCEEEGEGVPVVMAPPPSASEHTPLGAPAPEVPPPPPPLPASGQRRRRVRSFYWKPIPEERVHQRGEPNLWTLSQASGKHTFHIDIRTIEELFGQHESTRAPTTTSSRGRQSNGSLQEHKKEITILDSKRSMNVAIFLKRFKKPTQSIIEDILHGHSEAFGAEPLRELLKLLPESDEVEKLQAFRGDPSQLSSADSFMYQLTALPRFDLRVEAMLLKEEFSSLSSSLKKDISTLRSATRDLLNCVELHSILHLVLEAGNIMNAGGYGEGAAGFRLSSLLSLSDTKANKPGMNLLHFVAMEARKNDEQLLMFPEKLRHVEAAARVSVENLDEELESLSSRIKNIEENIQTDTDLMQQLSTFLQGAAVVLAEISKNRTELQEEGDKMINFFCEDKETFRLDECFHVFQTFCSKFRRAVQENVEQEMRAESRLKRLKDQEVKRSSWAGLDKVGGVFGSRCRSETDVQAALRREMLLGLLSPRSPQGHSENFPRSRQHLSDSSTNSTRSGMHSSSHTPTSADSVAVAHTHTDSHSEGMTAQMETHTLVPALQAFSFDPLPDQDLSQELSPLEADIRGDEMNRDPENSKHWEEPKNPTEENIATTGRSDMYISPNRTEKLTDEEIAVGTSSSPPSPPTVSLTDQSTETNTLESTNQGAELEPTHPSLLVSSSNMSASPDNTTSTERGQSVGPQDKRPVSTSPGRTVSTSKPAKILTDASSSSSQPPSSSVTSHSLRSVRTLNPSETQMLRKVISVSRNLHTPKDPAVLGPSHPPPPQKSTIQRSSVQRSSLQRSSIQEPSIQSSSTQKPSIRRSSIQRLPGERSSEEQSPVRKSSVQRPSTQTSSIQRSSTQRSSIQRPSIQRPSIQRSSTQKPSTRRSSIQRSSEERSSEQQSPVRKSSMQRPSTQTSSIQRSSTQTSSIQRSSTQRSPARKAVVKQKPPEEKMCRSTLRALAQAEGKVASPSQQKTPHSHAPHFAQGTVASTTRTATVTPGNLPVNHSTTTTSVKVSLPKQRTSLRLAHSRVTSGTPLPPSAGYIRNNTGGSLSPDSQDKSPRPAWR